MLTENQLKKSMLGISDKNLKFAKVISELFESSDIKTPEEKASFIAVIGYMSDSLNTNSGITGTEKTKKEMLQLSCVEFSKLKNDLRQLCKSINVDYEAVKQRYLKAINYV